PDKLLDDPEVQDIRFMLIEGTEDRTPLQQGSIHGEAERFAGLLRERGMSVRTLFPSGGHTYSAWKPTYPDAVAFLTEGWSAAPGPAHRFRPCARGGAGPERTALRAPRPQGPAPAPAMMGTRCVSALLCGGVPRSAGHGAGRGRRPVEPDMPEPRGSADGLRVAMLSMHTSPLDQPGTGDAGGMNVYIVEVARRLAERGAAVDVFTRATRPGQPPAVEIAPGATVRHIAAGPYGPLDKVGLARYLCPFTFGVLRTEAGHGPGHYDLVHGHYWLSGRAGMAVAHRWG